MNLKKLSYYLILSFVFIFTSCVKDGLDDKEEETILPEEEQEELSITKLVIPADFDFSTQQNVSVIILDSSPYAKYDVYAYNDSPQETNEITYINEEGETVTTTEVVSDLLNNLLFTAVPFNGRIEQEIVLPDYYDKIYLRRKENGKYSSEIISVIDNRVDYTYSGVSGKSGKAGVQDFLYCVNGNAELFQIDPLDGSYTAISSMPMGSYTVAIDQENKYLYSVGKSSPYPLMRYDMVNDQWSTIKNLGFGGPRLGYHTGEGLLYFANQSTLKKLDPVNGNTMSTWNIVGLDETGGGDLDFDSEGNIFMSTTSGLYGLEFINDSYFQATRISADNLPFYPPSMAFDSNDELWLSSAEGDADIMIMDTQTGGWEYRYGKNAEGSSSYGRAIHDFTTFRIFSENQEEVDTDGDGIVDGDDEYPDDADKAFETFTPSKYGNGTLAFEDLWPYQGDYDFNDLALNYKVIAVQNSQNKVVEVKFQITPKANGAGFTNAFGIEFENLDQTKVASVTGQVLTQGYINLNANGTESNQDNTVVIFYDNNHGVLNQDLEIVMTFTEPIETSELGTAPFNPFIIVDEDRSVEVHLPYATATTLGINNIVPEGNNKDIDKNYATDTGLPWAINIIHDFKVPKEKIPVNSAYNHFNTWAQSGGTSKADWYKDSAGYRNSSKLDD